MGSYAGAAHDEKQQNVKTTKANFFDSFFHSERLISCKHNHKSNMKKHNTHFHYMKQPSWGARRSFQIISVICSDKPTLGSLLVQTYCSPSSSLEFCPAAPPAVGGWCRPAESSYDPPSWKSHWKETLFIVLLYHGESVWPVYTVKLQTSRIILYLMTEPALGIVHIGSCLGCHLLDGALL